MHQNGRIGCLSQAPGTHACGPGLYGGCGTVIGPSGDWPDEVDERFAVEVVTVAGSAATVDFLIHLSAVEVWFQQRCRAVLNRRLLRSWLAEPQAPLVVDEVGFSVDRMVDHQGRVALSLPDVLVWTLAPEALAGLRRRV
jgi:hypothetical protein